MAKPAWKTFPHADKAFVYAGAALKKNWERLHCGDCEPFPADEAVQEAWRLYHQGEFQKACEAGLAAGLDGYNAANKATMIHATYLEDNGQRKLEMFQAISARCDELQRAQPKNANGTTSRPTPWAATARESRCSRPSRTAWAAGSRARWNGR
jgi:hypothetical protein